MGQIRTLQTDYLRKGSEQITYKSFDYDGVYQETIDENILFEAPKQIQPLNQDLSRQYERPLKRVEFSTKLRGDYPKNENAHFLFGDHRWSLQTVLSVSDANQSNGTSIEITTDEDKKGKAVSGNKYARTDICVNYTTPVQFVATDRQYTKVGAFQEVKIEFDYYIETTGSDEKYQIAIKALSQQTYDSNGSNGTPYSYDFANDEWDSGNLSTKYKDFTTTTVNAWGKASVTLKEYNTIFQKRDPVERSPVDEIFLTAMVCLPKLEGGGAGGFQNLFIDNFRVSESYDVENKIIARRKQYDKNGTYTAEYKFEDNNLSNEARSTDYFIGKIEGNFKRPRDTVNKTLEQVITHDILNDSRNFMRKYEGTFRGVTNDFLGMHHKVWVDFGADTLQEPVSCYIDAMKYDVKEAEYQIRMHIPNQDDDTGSTYNVYIE